MVETVRVARLLQVIEEQAVQLRRLSSEPTDTLLGDPVKVAAVKYFFVVAIEASIDVSRHLAVTSGLRAARSFADAFAVLAENGLLDGVLADRLADMARFRNLLVHGYAVVDDARVVDILRTRLGDLDDFRRQVAIASTTR